MLSIKVFHFNPFGENTVILWDETSQGVIIDPGCLGPKEEERLFSFISDEKVTAAAEGAQAAEFIAGKEGGMEAPVAIRGSNLSGGQKQRLLIARALAGDPEILILDDSSSALDYRTDALLRRALHADHSRTTTILIAQRISSLRHADQILVLDDGKVIGTGKHEDLMEQCPEYRIIAETQMGVGREEEV